MQVNANFSPFFPLSPFLPLRGARRQNMAAAALPETARALGAEEIARLREAGTDLALGEGLAQCLTQTLSAGQRGQPEGGSGKSKSEAARAACSLLAHISGQSSAGSEWALAVLTNADELFEELFESEIHHDSCALHVFVLAVLLDHSDKAFTGRHMYELTNGHIRRSLSVLSAFLDTFGDMPRRFEAGVRVLYELTVAVPHARVRARAHAEHCRHTMPIYPHPTPARCISDLRNTSWMATCMK